MTAIKHRLKIQCPTAKLYRALIAAEGLSQWWTRAETNSQPGSTATFSFGPQGEHRVVMEIVELKKNEKVIWRCIDGPWKETGLFTFNISRDEESSMLEFIHEGWEESGEFYMHCNSKWGFFLVVSLKNYLETGQGSPHPQDPDI